MRGQDVFVIQSTSTPVNDSIMELLICVDALEEHQQKVLPQYFLILLMRDKIAK